jgi:hypothetical protein
VNWGFVRNRCMTRAGAGTVLLVLACVAALCFPLMAVAAIEQHLFDPRISLTGTCSTEPSDEIVDPWCPGPPAPSQGFEKPNIGIDSFGDMYVSSFGTDGSTGRVDVFSPEGDFITELGVPFAGSVAVDSSGNLYVHQNQGPDGIHQVTLYRPTVYQPGLGKIAYSAGEVVTEGVESSECLLQFAGYVGLAVDPDSDHLFVSSAGCVDEWSAAGNSPADGPELLEHDIGSGVLTTNSKFIAVDAAHNRLYVSDNTQTLEEGVIKVFELSSPYAYLGMLDGHSTPNGKLLAHLGLDTVAVDETSGNLFVSELSISPVVYEFGPGLDADEELLNTYDYPGFRAAGSALTVAVDNSPTSPNHRTFYVPSEAKLDHTFAFRFSEEGPPEIASAAAGGVTETEAVLKTTINPNGGVTKYRIEYTAAASGFEGALLAAAGTLPSGIASIPVSAPITGLTPGTTYRFRVSAENGAGSDQREGSVRTYSAADLGGPCPNDPLRSGFSASLPDCRAYELVTPPDTNGRSPHAAGQTGLYFPTLPASPDGSKVSFRIEGGTIPGFEGSGSFTGDNYLAKRGADGWNTELISERGTDALGPAPGGVSPDQEYAFWRGETTLENFNHNAHIRYPDGHSEPVGRGSLGTDTIVESRLISDHGAHIIFDTIPSHGVQLEPDAPPAGTSAIYDRTGDETTHVVSLLPGNVTPDAGENAIYRGASLDGEGVAFEFASVHAGTLYLRQNNEATYEIGHGLTYAGIAEGGGRIFYLKGGNLFAFDTSSKAAIQFSSGGSATPVNISADGTTAYFVSPDVLTGKRENPDGAVAQPGQENLYVSREGHVAFVGTVEPSDVEELHSGLGLWLASLSSSPGIETSRLTPDGSALLFEARAPLAGYDSNGHKEIYRFDLSAFTLTCLSCNPTGAAATGDATLQSLPGDGTVGVIGRAARILNISPDGDRAFFQSEEALVPQDVDNRQDIYEWEAQGVGSCAKPGGCVYLISYGQSDRDEYLFAVSESGDDVFFASGSLLLAGDEDLTLSVYDARVDGGFPEPQAEAPCQDEGCKGSLTAPPALPAPATPDLGQNGNVSQRHCGTGKRKVRRHGKVRCVKKRHRHHHPRHASQKKGQSK